MRVFLSYSRADLAIAERIAAHLKQAGHDVFFDRESIRAADDFNRVIWSEIRKADLFVFLISPSSTRPGSYALTELMFAEKKWPNPERRVLPVVIEPTELPVIPVYASITHILRPEGNLAAEVRVEVNALAKRHRLKRVLQASALLGALIVISLLAFKGYELYLDQRPNVARAKLVAMDLFSDEAFIESASRGDSELLELYLTAGMDPNVSPESGGTALMRAAGAGHLEVVERLLEAGADVNARTSDAAPALAWAAVGGDEAMVRALLRAGANSQSVNRAFSSAASRDNVDNAILELLLEQGVAQSEVDKTFVEAARKGDIQVLELLVDRVSEHTTVLSEALVKASANFTVDMSGSFREKGIAVFGYLLDQGADVNFQSKDGEFTALILVASRGYLKLAQMLLERGADPDIRCDCSGYYNGGWTALTLALKRKSLGSVREDRDRDLIIDLLLGSGADVNLPRKTQDWLETPLMLAASGGDLQLLLNLLDRGARVNDQNHNGYTALAYAADNKEILAALLDHGANMHVGASPLLMNIRKNHYRAVNNLLDAGADVNKPDSDGQTALMRATIEGDPDLVRILLEAGARTTDTDKLGRTAEVFAKRNKNTEIVELLKSAAQ